MNESEEEGTEYAGIFVNRFGQNRTNTEIRMKNERIAGMTPKQRQARAKKPPKKQINIRASDETRELIYALAAHLGKSVTDTVELAIRAYADSLPNFKRGTNAAVSSTRSRS